MDKKENKTSQGCLASPKEGTLVGERLKLEKLNHIKLRYLSVHANFISAIVNQEL